MTQLGRLERVELRDIWQTEAGDFTPWLAGEENIKLLGETIGIDLEVEAQEKSVGPFRADILCKDTANDHWVLVENQLERTDHTHMGQLITYAAGLNTVTIVWIAARFTDEHRAALDWLNEMTGEEIGFFGLEVELWKIGDSNIAPKFNIVSKPNDWTKTVAKGARAAKEAALTPAKQLQQEYWQSFREYVDKNGATFNTTKAHPQHWMNISIGRSGFSLIAIASLWDSQSGSYDKHEVRAEFGLNDENAKNYFSQLEDEKESIENELGEQLTWHNPENKKASRVFLQETVDLNDRARWSEYHDWHVGKLEALKRVFAPRVKVLQVVDQE